MPYKYLEDMSTADEAFKAWGHTPEELFSSAADAVMNLMVENFDSISAKEKRRVSLADESLELLLFQFLQEFIYYKDAETLLLRVEKIQISVGQNVMTLESDLYGERITPGKHKLNVDIKAVTLHRLQVTKTEQGWEAVVVVDI